MSVDYSIKAIPTIYNGRRYRSRLEARWACFFDLLKWNFEYEPCDFGAWSPDFALWGKRPKSPIYVEVKPIREWDRDTARKMADACESKLLLLGVGPNFDLGWTCLGYLAEHIGGFEARWSYAVLERDRLGRADFYPEDHTLCPESWLWENLDGMAPHSQKSLWIEAANTVQWIKKSR